MWTSLLLKFPILAKVGGFLTSGRFLAFIGAVIIIIFLFTQATTFVGKYVDREVNQKVDISMSHNKITDLENQVKVLKQNQQIVAEVTKETRIVQQQQQQKSDKIEEKINEQVKEGHDGYTPSITSTVIDSL